MSHVGGTNSASSTLSTPRKAKESSFLKPPVEDRSADPNSTSWEIEFGVIQRSLRHASLWYACWGQLWFFSLCFLHLRVHPDDAAHQAERMKPNPPGGLCRILVWLGARSGDVLSTNLNETALRDDLSLCTYLYSGWVCMHTLYSE